MSSARLLVSLVDQFRAERGDVPWLEFRRQPHEPWSKLGESLSAVGNGASLARRPFGYVLVGIDPTSREVVGVAPRAAEWREHEPGHGAWFESMLRATSVARLEVDHPAGRVVMFEVARASGRPLRFLGRGYVIMDGRPTGLEAFGQLEEALWRRPDDWSAQAVNGATLGDLDPAALAAARGAFLAPLPALRREAQAWTDFEFLERARLSVDGAITRAALLLLGRPQAARRLAPAVPRITWVLRDGLDHAVEHAHAEPPFFTSADELLGRIRNPSLPPAPGLAPDQRQYDPVTLRETIMNAMAHQDYELSGWIHVLETPDRVVVTNPGRWGSAAIERVVARGAAGDAVQNPFLARAMAQLGMIDLGGGGIQGMLRRQWARGLPLPDLETHDALRVRVTVHGRVIDPAFAPLARAHPTLDLQLVRSLDRIQKGLRVEPETRRELQSRGLVEGKEPITVLAGSFARAAGAPVADGQARAVGNAHLREAVLALVRARGSVARADVEAVLLPRLPLALSDLQRRTKVDNVVKFLARAGSIVNHGSRRYPRWVLSKPEAGADRPRSGRPATIDEGLRMATDAT